MLNNKHKIIAIISVSFLILLFTIIAIIIVSGNKQLPSFNNIACTMEAKICPDGSAVGRNPKNNCEFDACPVVKDESTGILCTQDVKECADGSFVGRDPENDCKFKLCPTVNTEDSEQEL
jgi:hypothetical protein